VFDLLAIFANPDIIWLLVCNVVSSESKRLSSRPHEALRDSLIMIVGAPVAINLPLDNIHVGGFLGIIQAANTRP
jgi:hypothetical protein